MKATIPAALCLAAGVGLGFLLHHADKQAHKEGFRLGTHAALRP